MRYKRLQFEGLIKVFVVLAGLTFGMLLTLSIGGYFYAKAQPDSISSMTGLASSVESDFFKDMIVMELPQVTQKKDKGFTFSAGNVMNFLLQFFTGIDPENPKSLLASEVYGLANEQAFLLNSGQATDRNEPPKDYTPGKAVLEPEDDQSKEHEQEQGVETAAENESADDAEPQDKTDSTGEDKIKVFAYSSHNRESWIPELEEADSPDQAYDSEVNVTLLSSRLSERMNNSGIGAASTDVDYASTVTEYNWNFSYKYSLQTVREATAVYPELEYYIDIHRDSQNREYTTTNIDGLDYAQIYFVIGHKNPNWQKNEAFASALHELLEQRYPGISRGVWGKSANTGHAEYNQSISPNSILVEVGGVENTLEESYRTIDVLSEVLADYFWENQALKAETKPKEE